jgi:hypothetical protein
MPHLSASLIMMMVTNKCKKQVQVVSSSSLRTTKNKNA